MELDTGEFAAVWNAGAATAPGGTVLIASMGSRSEVDTIFGDIIGAGHAFVQRSMNVAPQCHHHQQANNPVGGAGHDERVTPTQHRDGIRAALPQDRESIIEVALLSGLFPPEGITDIEATLASFFAGQTDGDQWLVSILESRVAAIAYYAPERMTDGTWNLYLLAVHPEHQGQGLGGALVQQVEQDLLQASARVLLIETSGVPDFAGQRAFYTQLGYYEEARIREFYAPCDDKVVYWKRLQRAQPVFPAQQERSV